MFREHPKTRILHSRVGSLNLVWVTVSLVKFQTHPRAGCVPYFEPHQRATDWTTDNLCLSPYRKSPKLANWITAPHKQATSLHSLYRTNFWICVSCNRPSEKFHTVGLSLGQEFPPYPVFKQQLGEESPRYSVSDRHTLTTVLSQAEGLRFLVYVKVYTQHGHALSCIYLLF